MTCVSRGPQARRRRTFLLTLAACLALSSRIGTAQVSPEEHAKHHPPPNASPGAAAPVGSSPAPMAGGMGDMGKMMEGMGKIPPKDLYPTLMNLPQLSPQQRAEVEKQARTRLAEAVSTMAQAAGKLAAVTPNQDYPKMQSATTELRQGLSDFDSGLAALQALNEGKAPQSVALQWFKTQMNLVPVVGYAPSARTLFGLSFFHFFVMLALVAFVVVMVWMYFFKMRRAADLLRRLSDGGGPSEGGPGVAKPSPSPGTPPGDSKPAPGGPAPAAPAPPKESKPAPAAQAAPAAPIEPAAAAPLPSGKWKGILRVNRIFVETPDVKTFRFTAMDGGPIPFTYLPGQFLTLAAVLDGRRIQRSYTMASSPTQRHYCELTIKREEHGAESRYLHDGLQEGDLVEVAGPSGKFTFTGAEAKNVVLIGGGVGITPFMSTVRYLTDIGWGGEIFFLYTCRHVHDFIFREELERLCARTPKLHLVVTITQPGAEPWSGLTGHLTKEQITQAVPDIATRRIHVCGPDKMMKAVQGALLELDVPAAQVKTEAFGAAQKAPTEDVETPPQAAATAPPAPAAKAPPETAAPAPAKGAAAEAPPAAAAGATQAASVTFKRSGKPAPLPAGKTVLEASEDVGVNIDYECRVGTCGTCKVKLLSGKVTMEVEDGLDPGDKENNIILACQAKSAADVIVDAYVARAQVQNAGPTGL